MKTRTHFTVLLTLLSGLLLWPAIASAQEEVVYYHTDAIGSVRAITDHNGDTIARYDYLPFGELWPATPPAPDERRQFAGKERDFESTGLDYFGARYHRPVSGRFTTVDPVMNVEAALVDPQRWNRYSYARNNPFVYVDPDGRQIWLSGAHQRALSEAGRRAAPAAAIGVAAAGIVGLIQAGPVVWRSAVGCVLSPSCQATAVEILEGAAGGAPRIALTGDIDAAAGVLARKIGGQASVMIQGFGNREFDAVSAKYVAQTFSGESALLSPDNFLGSARRNQIRATLEAAKATGRTALFEFTNGVHKDVIDFIQRNAERTGVGFEIYR